MRSKCVSLHCIIHVCFVHDYAHARVCMYVSFSSSVWPFKRFLQGRGGREDNGSRHYLLLSCRLNIRPHTVWPSPTRTPSRCTCAHAPNETRACGWSCTQGTTRMHAIKSQKPRRPALAKSHTGERFEFEAKGLYSAADILKKEKEDICIFAWVAQAFTSPLRARAAALPCVQPCNSTAHRVRAPYLRIHVYSTCVCVLCGGMREGSRFHSQSGSISSGRPQSWPPRGKLPTVGTSRDDCPCWRGLHMRTPNADPRCQTRALLCIYTHAHARMHTRACRCAANRGRAIARR